MYHPTGWWFHTTGWDYIIRVVISYNTNNSGYIWWLMMGYMIILVGVWPTPLNKWWTSSVGMILPNIWKVMKFMFQTTKQVQAFDPKIKIFFLQRKRFENESLLSPYLFSRVMQSWWMAIAELMAVPSCRHINAYQLLLLSEDDPPSTMCVSHDIAYHDIKTWVHGWIWYNLMIRATITKVTPHPHDKKKESGLCYPAGPTVPRPRPFEVCN